MSPYRIVLVDDHNVVRQGIKKIIVDSAVAEVVGEARDGLELLNLLKRIIPDLVILDISMPNLRGIEVIKEVRTLYPAVKVLILTMHKEEEYLCHAIGAGARGYLIKEDTDKELVSAIETIRQGKIYLSPSLPTKFQDKIMYVLHGEAKLSPERLTTREREILQLIAEGKSSKDIAELLFISIRTVEHHRASIMNKLQAKKVTDLVRYAIRKGYTSNTV